VNKNEAMRILSTIRYPGYSKTLTDFKIVKSIEIKDNIIEVLLNLGAADSNKRQIIFDEIKAKFEEKGAKAKISTVQEKGSTIEQKHYVQSAKKRIAILSAKGGVGKSTFSVALTIALKKRGHSVGIFDADMHGPDVPRMLGVSERAGTNEEKNKIIPNEKDGIFSMSLGYVVDPETPVIWKGAMVTKAIVELLQFTDWPEMDFFIIDLPPGTGDAALTIKQNMDVDGAVIVTTPNRLAIADAMRTVGFFEQVGVKITGFVENMGYFVCNKCGGKSYPFGKTDPKYIEGLLRVPSLGVIPFDPKVEEAADDGNLMSVIDTEFFNIMDSIAEKIEKI